MHQDHLETVSDSPLGRWLVGGQALYFLATGIWPLVHAGSFQKVTGPKTDFWLVKTTGLLIAVVGAALLVSSVRERVPPETLVVGAGSSAALAAVDVAYVAKGRIAPVYLLDAVAQLALLAGWGWVALRKS